MRNALDIPVNPKISVPLDQMVFRTTQLVYQMDEYRS